MIIFSHYANGINTKKSYFKLKEIGITIHPNTLYRIYHVFRIAISNYIQDSYRENKMKEGDAIEADESLFSHHLNQQVWAIGLYGRQSNEIRLFTVTNRTKETIK